MAMRDVPDVSGVPETKRAVWRTDSSLHRITIWKGERASTPQGVPIQNQPHACSLGGRIRLATLWMLDHSSLSFLPFHVDSYLWNRAETAPFPMLSCNCLKISRAEGLNYFAEFRALHLLIWIQSLLLDITLSNFQHWYQIEMSPHTFQLPGPT